MRWPFLTIATFPLLLSCSTDPLVGPGKAEVSFRGHPIPGAHDHPPVPMVRVKPNYPAFAREAQIEGIVVIQVQVGLDGTATDVIVRRGVTGLNDAAGNAASQWTFAPARSNGAPATSWYQITFLFSLDL